MYRIVLVLVLIPLTAAVGKGKDDDFDSCRTGQSEMVKKISSYRGDGKIKRLIEADLTRAGREEAEGDADECLEALDHANKLLAGQY